MASKRRPLHGNLTNSAKFNFRPSATDSSRGGTRPTTDPVSVKEILTLMVLHLCKKSLFFDTNLKVGLYLAILFILSLLADNLPVPRTYFARSDNILNKYFVKFAWGWNLVLLVPFVTLTALTYCCGNIKKAFKEHFPRVVIATVFWFLWTKLFNIIENSYGKCSVKSDKYIAKSNCLQDGYFWNGFDISGHSFILIYGSLVLIEEARAIIGWESIKEMIRNEEHCRSTRDTVTSNPLRTLNDHELLGVKVFYEKFTPAIRGLFVAITILQLLWDIMLISTILYYHIMIEKFLGGVFAILTWFFTYRAWYKIPNLLPNSPGEGPFKYNKPKSTTPLNRKASVTKQTTSDKQMPKFMGMPLYGLKTESIPSTSTTET